MGIWIVNPNEYGDGIEDADRARIAEAEAAGIRAKFPDATVSIGTDRSGEDRFSMVWEEIADYVDSVWNEIHATCGGHGPSPGQAIERWKKEACGT